jgi:hypothetical protein
MAYHLRRGKEALPIIAGRAGDRGASIPNSGGREISGMIVRFREKFRLPASEVYDYFRSPRDWVRLFGFAGDTKDLGGGWFAVALKRFPFPLVARNVQNEPNRFVRWEFRGFWRGKGEVRFTETPEGVLVEGFEEIAVRWLFFLSPLVERLFLERSFRAIWALGWHRLRKTEKPDVTMSAWNHDPHATRA